MNKSTLRRGAVLQSNGANITITIATLPASVKLDAGRIEEGRFLILTDPSQKLYWWRFQAGAPQASPEAEAAEFGRSCTVVPGRGRFGVFCSTDRRIMVSISKKTYSNENELAGLVENEFNGRAGKLDSGFDYFEKVLDLWSTLGADFFAETGRANSLRKIPFLSVKPQGDGWEVVVGGANGQSARVVLSPTLELVEAKVLPRQGNRQER